MRTLGIITSAGIALIALVGVALGLRSVGDIRRYLRMRSM